MREGSELAMLWVLKLSDGYHTLLDIAERSGRAFDVIQNAAKVLLEHSLVEGVSQVGTIDVPRRAASNLG
jgi:aminopeptidase-like protein